MRFQWTPRTSAIVVTVIVFVLMFGVVALLDQGYRGWGPPEVPTPTPMQTPTPGPTPTQWKLAPAPSEIRVTAVTATTVTLSWESIPGAYEYLIERSYGGQEIWATNCWEARYRRHTTDAEFTDSGMDPGRTHYYRVCTRGNGTRYADWFGPPSEVLRVVTLPDDTATP